MPRPPAALGLEKHLTEQRLKNKIAVLAIFLASAHCITAIAVPHTQHAAASKTISRVRRLFRGAARLPEVEIPQRNPPGDSPRRISPASDNASDTLAQPRRNTPATPPKSGTPRNRARHRFESRSNPEPAATLTSPRALGTATCSTATAHPIPIIIQVRDDGSRALHHLLTQARCPCPARSKTPRQSDRPDADRQDATRRQPLAGLEAVMPSRGSAFQPR